MRKTQFLSGLTLACFILAACSTPTPTSNLQPTATQGVYPEPVQSSTTSENVIPFRINKPLVAGMTTISGSGTPGVPIGLLNITMMGETLGQTTIKSDGSFSIQVPPLVAGIRIGLLLGELAGTKWKAEDFNINGYFGDEARLIPMVGFFFDTALVLEK